MSEPGVTVLERRYRSALRLLPRGYRALWEDEMVATFLDSMQTDDPDEAEFRAEFGRPSWSELASVVLLAVRLRLGITGDVPARYRTWGAGLRLVALMLLLYEAVFGIVGVLNRLWRADVLAYVPRPAADWTPEPLPAEFWRLAWQFNEALWPLAFLALVLGRRSAARVLTVLAMLASAGDVLAVLSRADWQLPPWALAWWAYELLLLNGLVLVGLAAFGGETPRARPWPWLLAMAGGVPISYAVPLGVIRLTNAIPLSDPDGLACAVLTVVGALWLAAPRLGWALRGSAWPLALAVVCMATFGMRVISLVAYAEAGLPMTHASLVAGIAEATTVLAVGTALAVRTGSELRRLPTPAEAGSWSGV
jgi:hypothetical protein